METLENAITRVDVPYRLVANGGSFEIHFNGKRIFSAYQIAKCFDWFAEHGITNHIVG